MKSLELKESYLGVNPSNLNKHENPEVLKCKIIKIPVLKYFQKATGFRIRRLFKKKHQVSNNLWENLSPSAANHLEAQTLKASAKEGTECGKEKLVVSKMVVRDCLVFTLVG